MGNPWSDVARVFGSLWRHSFASIREEPIMPHVDPTARQLLTREALALVKSFDARRELRDAIEARESYEASLPPDPTFERRKSWTRLFLDLVVGFLLDLRPTHDPRRRRGRVRFTIGDISGEKLMLTIKATGPARTLRVAFQDSEGNPAVINGVPTWAASVPELGALTPSEDGLSCVFDPGSPISGQISVTGDPTDSDTDTPVIGVLDVVVVPGDAQMAVISVDPEPSA